MTNNRTRVLHSVDPKSRPYYLITGNGYPWRSLAFFEFINIKDFKILKGRSMLNDKKSNKLAVDDYFLFIVVLNPYNTRMYSSIFLLLWNLSLYNIISTGELERVLAKPSHSDISSLPTGDCPYSTYNEDSSRIPPIVLIIYVKT